MPAKPPRRRADAAAGPTITDDRALAAVPTSSAAPLQARPRKFTALLDTDTEARFSRLLDDVRSAVGRIATRTDGTGRTRAGYDPSRADVLRALLAVAESDPVIREALHAQVRRDLTGGITTS